MRILIDPAHGGENLGDVSLTGMLEKQATLAAAEALRRRLKDADLTRDDDVDVSHGARARRVKDYDLCVSLHFHRTTEPWNGRVEVSARTERAEGLGLLILEELESRTGDDIRYNRFVGRIAQGDIPVVLVMGGAFNHKATEQQMIRGDRYDMLADGIAAAIERFRG